MSIYFYSTNEAKEIKALCGVKALILPVEIAKKIKNKLDNIAREKLSIEVLEKEYKESLKQILDDETLKEEYNHFKCLVQSKAANFFHIRNILLRHTYSSYTLPRIIDPALHPHSIFRDVIKYFIDYAYFHYAAYPFIEAHHIILTKNKQERGDFLYQERIKKAVNFLEKYLENPGEKESSYSRVGNLVDRNFYLLLKKDRKTFTAHEYTHAIEINRLKRFNHYIWLCLIMFGRLLKRPILWGELLRLLRKKIKIVFPYILGRLFPKLVVKHNTGVLPAILSDNKISIDPVAFIYDSQSIHSEEKKAPSPLHGGLANLLWHILSRCAVIASFIDLDLDEVEIYTYFKKLRRFNEHWRHQIKDVQFDMDLLDNHIIYQVTNQFEKHPDYPPWKRIAHLEKIAFNIFKKYREEASFDFRESSPYNSAVNCSYMHI
jgi:hypothetical protein